MKKLDFFSDINKDNYEVLNYDKIDRFMINVLWWHFAVLFCYSLAVVYLKPSNIYPSPFSWSVKSLKEGLIVILISLIVTAVITLIRGRLKNHYLFRFFIANALFIYSYLIVYITGGSIEAHFHFFIVFAILTFYRDWRLGWWGILVVALHHGGLDLFAPYWVYYYGQNHIAFVAHALMVFIMAIYTTKICESGRRDMESIKNINVGLEERIKERTNELEVSKTGLEKKVKERTFELEKIKADLEKTVEQRTVELQKKIKELEKMNRFMTDREIKMVELKNEMEKIKKEQNKA